MPGPEQWTPEQAYKARVAYASPSMSASGKAKIAAGLKIYEELNPDDAGLQQRQYEELHPEETQTEPIERVLDPIKIQGDPTRYMSAEERAAYGRSKTLQTFADFTRGAASGATLGWGDEATAAIMPDEGSALDRFARAVLGAPPADMSGVPRDYGGTDRDTAMRDTLRREAAEAAERSPWAYGGGQAIGGLVATAPIAALAPGGGAGLMQSAAAIGALSGAGESESDTASGVVLDAAGGALVGAGTAGVLRGGAGMIQSGASKASEAMRAIANRQRVGAAMPGSDVRAIMESKGLMGAEKMGEDIERLGMHRGIGLLGWLPQPARTYLDNAIAVADRSGQKIGAILDSATNKRGGATSINRHEFAARLDAFADDLQRVEGDIVSSDSKTHMIREQAARLRDRAMPSDSGMWIGVAELNNLKSKFNAAAYRGILEKRGTEAEVSQGLGRASRDMLMERMTAAHPEKLAPLQQAFRDYGVADTVQTGAAHRVALEMGNQPVSLPSLVAAAAGAHGGIPGNLSGLAAGQAMKTRGRSSLAGLGRLGQRSAGGVEDAARAIQDAPIEEMSGVFAPQLRAGSIASVAHAEQQALGNEVGAVVRDALEFDPAALGPYADQLQTALDDGADAFSAELYRLSQDETFKKSYLPRFLQQTR